MERQNLVAYVAWMVPGLGGVCNILVIRNQTASCYEGDITDKRQKRKHSILRVDTSSKADVGVRGVENLTVSFEKEFMCLGEKEVNPPHLFCADTTSREP